MKRRSVTILFVVSVLLFVAVIAVWGRSYFAEDILYLQTTPRMYGVSTETGTIVFFTWGDPDPQEKLWGYMTLPSPGPKMARMRSRTVRHRDAFGFGYFAGAMHRQSYRALTAPIWFAAVLSAALLGFSLGYRRRMLRQPGLCASCGYDLRATPERCPECGSIAKDAAHVGKR